MRILRKECNQTQQSISQGTDRLGQAVVESAKDIKPVATGVAVVAGIVAVVTSAPAWATVATVAGAGTLVAQGVKTIDNPSTTNKVEFVVDAVSFGVGSYVGQGKPFGQAVRAGIVTTSEARAMGVASVGAEAAFAAAATNTLTQALTPSQLPNK